MLIYSISMRKLYKYSKAYIFLCFLAFACTSEDYETGDGTYSYLSADFADLHTDADAKVVSAMTDGGDSLLFSRAFESKQLKTPDSTYRALLYYYKKVIDGKVEPYGLKAVSVPIVKMTSRLKGEMKTDPVSLQSAWMSQNNRYVNLTLVLKTGQPDEKDAVQTVGMMCDTVMQQTDGTQLMKLRFYHDQGKVPQYYSTTVYMSLAFGRLPVKVNEGDQLEISVNTYDGERQLNFTVPSLP